MANAGDAVKRVIKRKIDAASSCMDNLDDLEFAMNRLVDGYFNRQKFSLRSVIEVKETLKTMLNKIDKGA